MTNNTDLVRVHDALRVLATLLRTPEFMAQFDPEKFAGKLERIADALAQQPAPVGDDPIDAKDNAGYIEHCADRLERLGHRVTAGALRVIAIEHRALAQQHAAPSDETLRLAGVIADKIEDGTLFQAGIFSRRDLADKIRAVVRFARQGVPPAALASAPVAREAVAWLRMKPDGTPDWAEDCIGSDDRFLDHELASDGYYLQPLYTAPQQPAAVDEAAAQRLAEAVKSEPGWSCLNPQARVEKARRYLAIAANRQEGE